MPKLTIQTRQKLQIAGALLALSFVLLVWHCRQNDRTVERAELSNLLINARWAPYDFQLVARDRIHSLGTNAIPLCLEYVSIDPSRTYWRFNDRLAKINQRLAISSHSYIEIGIAGFEALGPTAQPAVPELLNLMTNCHSQPYYIALALGATRDPRALALFQTYIKDTDPDLRYIGMTGLGAMGKGGNPMQAELIQLSQNDPDPNVRASATSALGTQGNPTLIVPHLIYLLQNDTNEFVRFSAASALGNFPDDAAQIRPLLDKVSQGPSRYVGNGALIGLTMLKNAESLNGLKGPANAELIRIRSQQR